jgi:hypothetical protein
VPAKRGGRVRIWTGEEGTIIWTYQSNLKIRLDDGTPMVIHPAFGLLYYDGMVQT